MAMKMDNLSLLCVAFIKANVCFTLKFTFLQPLKPASPRKVVEQIKLCWELSFPQCLIYTAINIVPESSAVAIIS
jgi:hypothetical protein